MKKLLGLSVLVLAVLAGSASADRRRGRGHHKRHHHHQPYVWRGSVHVEPRIVVRERPRARVMQRPIYVQRPVIAVRYREYDRRPACVHEDYAPMTGYTWVAGQWAWNGYEWIWQPGRYEPDPSYVDYSQQQYYDGGSYYEGY